MADRFNQTVALDLKFLEGSEIILHCIDLLTRYSVAVTIRSKEREVIVENFFKSWIAIFGRPAQTLCDNGKEFCNQAFVDMCSHLDINMKTTAAFAPFSNGVVERHNGLLAEMVYKIKEDAGCSTDIALCWAVNAKNNMCNAYGFSPQQLVLGYNSAPPGLDDLKINLNQLDNEKSSQMVADHINALHESRKAFILAQNSDRLKRALKDRVYSSYEVKYFPGDQVYYKTIGKSWKGPGVVIGQYQKLVLIKTGGLFVRVHPSRIKLKTEVDNEINSDKPATLNKSNEQDNIVRTIEDSDSESDSDSEDSCPEQTGSQTKLHDKPNTEQEQIRNVENSSDIQTETDQDTVTWKNVAKDLNKNRIVLNQGDEIRFKVNEDDDFKEATVIGNSGRLTSRASTNKDKYNIMSPGGSQSSVFVDRVAEIQRKFVDINSVNYNMTCIEDEKGVYLSKTPDNDMIKKIKLRRK